MIKTAATLLSGFEGVGIGMKQAGLDHLWGIEKEDDIAQVARENGFNVITADILDVDPRTLPFPDALHISPVCTRISVANTKGKEAQIDIDVAVKFCEFVDVMQPKVITVENVWGYRNTESFKRICDCLERNGYTYRINHINCADFGVPQTRKRLILRAVKGMLLPLLPKKERWVGWYRAIEDLIPTLPDSTFAAWQLKRLPAECRNFLVQVQGQNGDGVLFDNEPMQTVTANHSAGKYRGLVVGGANTSDEQANPGVGVSLEDEPTRLVNASNSQYWRAFLTDSCVNTIPTAILVEGRNANGGTDRLEEEPAGTVHTSHPPRAFVVDNFPSTTKAGKTIQVNGADEPVGTVVSSHSAFRDGRIWDGCGRVVKLTPRCLARFQSFPDLYKLPAWIIWEIATDQKVVAFEDENQGNINKKLACQGIGNAVPPRVIYKLYSQFTGVRED